MLLIHAVAHVEQDSHMCQSIYGSSGEILTWEPL